jgi:hypothetical protein
MMCWADWCLHRNGYSVGHFRTLCAIFKHPALSLRRHHGRQSVGCETFFAHKTYLHCFFKIKTNRCTDFQIYTGMKLYMFRAASLPILRSNPLYIRHWLMLYRFDDRLRAGSGCKWVHVPVPNVQWISPEDGQRNCPKHVDFRTRINLEIGASVAFYCKEICYDARSYERKIIHTTNFVTWLCLHCPCHRTLSYTLSSIWLSDRLTDFCQIFFFFFLVKNASSYQKNKLIE